MAALKFILSSRVSKWIGHSTIATIFLPTSYCQTYSGYPRVGFCLSTGALAHRARDTVAFLERKVPDFISLTLWSLNSPDLNPVDYSIWSVLQKKVYRFTITNVSELDMSLINESGRFVQPRGCCYRLVAPSSQRLCPWSGAHFEHQA